MKHFFTRKYLFIMIALCLSLGFMLVAGTGKAFATWVPACVYCDRGGPDDQGDGILGWPDTPLPGVTAIVSSLSGPYTNSGQTDEYGCAFIEIPYGSDTYRETLDSNTLPSDATILIPLSGEYIFDDTTVTYFNWLIDSAICHAAPECGDGNIDEGETCDPPGTNAGTPYECRDDCTFCGDGIQDIGEECDDGNNDDGDGCSSTCQTETFGEGCTPGYWRNHDESWAATGYSPDDDFDSTFGVDFFTNDITLYEAVWLGGGGVKKVARHGTAALLNAAHPDVGYPLTVAEVIAAVQAKDIGDIVNYNELSPQCPAE